MALVEIKNFVAFATNLIEALNITYVNGAFGEAVYLQIIEMMSSKNIIVSKHPGLRDQTVLQDFNVEEVKELSLISRNILKLKHH